GGHRAVATSRVKEVGDIFTATPDPDPLRLDQLRQRLNDTLNTLKQLDEALMPHIDAVDVTKEIEDSARIRDDMFAALARIEHALKPSHRPAVTPTVTPAVSPTVTVNLPKLTSRHFNGVLTGWVPFWDAHKAAVHDNVSLSNVDKFNYL
uniref:Uncharacterized protein n=1 Tax=Amphimedon queenslandica TaxID=400682 RepID=A0A1X7UBK9_AMPQE